MHLTCCNFDRAVAMLVLALNQQKIKCINVECYLHDGIELACALHCLTNSVSFSPSLFPVLLLFFLPILPPFCPCCLFANSVLVLHSF